MEKVCIRCHTSQTLDSFSKNKTTKDGLDSYCKVCNKIKCTAYREANREVIRKKDRRKYKNDKNKFRLISQKYRAENRDKALEATKQWRLANPEKSRDSVLNWQRNNKGKINEYLKTRRRDNPLFKLSHNLRTLIRKAITRQGYKKTTKTCSILGCSFEDFKLHLEDQFLPWMSWANYGWYNGAEEFGWDIDHKIPLSSATTEEALIKLNHYSNLQPLCSRINRDVKRDSVIISG